MKILRIESPSKLKDGTVKASIIVSKEDYIPLIILGDRGDKGEVIDLDIKEHETIYPDDGTKMLMTMIKEFGDKRFDEGKKTALAPETNPINKPKNDDWFEREDLRS